MKKKFEAIKYFAAHDVELALISGLDKSTGKPVAVICHVGRRGEKIDLTPLGQVFEEWPSHITIKGIPMGAGDFRAE